MAIRNGTDEPCAEPVVASKLFDSVWLQLEGECAALPGTNGAVDGADLRGERSGYGASGPRVARRVDGCFDDTGLARRS
jgi:hypothetical protein